VEAAVEEGEWVKGWSLPRACVGQRRFFWVFPASRAFTIFFTRAVGKGLSTGNWSIEAKKKIATCPPSSGCCIFLKALDRDVEIVIRKKPRSRKAVRIVVTEDQLSAV
jgi:hypothetical protein